MARLTRAFLLDAVVAFGVTLKIDPAAISDIAVSPVAPSAAAIAASVAQKEVELEAAKAQSVVFSTSAEGAQTLEQMENLRAKIVSDTELAQSLFSANKDKIVKLRQIGNAIRGAAEDARKYMHTIEAGVQTAEKNAVGEAISEFQHQNLNKKASEIRKQAEEEYEKLKEEEAKVAENSQQAIQELYQSNAAERSTILDYHNRARMTQQQATLIKEEAIKKAKQAELYSIDGHTWLANNDLEAAHNYLAQADGVQREANRWQTAAEQLNAGIASLEAAQKKILDTAKKEVNPGGFDGSLPPLPQGIEFEGDEGAEASAGSAPAAEAEE